jgi:hypothetical protein
VDALDGCECCQQARGVWRVSGEVENRGRDKMAPYGGLRNKTSNWACAGYEGGESQTNAIVVEEELDVL